MLVCSKCGGKVFVDLTFTDNKNYETFCIRCGNRWYVGKHHPLFKQLKQYVMAALTA